MSTASHRLRSLHERQFCAGFDLDCERIAVLTAPYVGALRLVQIAREAGDTAALQNAMGELAEAALAVGRVETIASLAERRLAIHRRRQPKVR